jgi:hypothetical protein
MFVHSLNKIYFTSNKLKEDTVKVQFETSNAIEYTTSVFQELSFGYFNLEEG